MTTPPWCREKVMVYYYYLTKKLTQVVMNANIVNPENLVDVAKQTLKSKLTNCPLLR